MSRYNVTLETEAFDLSRIRAGQADVCSRQAARACYAQFVIGVKNFMPADKRIFDIGEGTFKTLGGPHALGCAAAMGHHRLEVNE